jgi:hypothetical protein
VNRKSRLAKVELTALPLVLGGMTVSDFRRKWGNDALYLCAIAPLCGKAAEISPDVLADFARLNFITVRPFDYLGI